MRSQSRLNRLWTMDQGLCTRIIITTLALACTFAWAGKPSKPPPEPQAGYRMVDLVGPGGSQSTAWKINEAGWVVGEASYDLGNDHAFLVIPEYADGDGIPGVWAQDENEDGRNDLMIDLSTLGSGGSTACGINDHGQIVGMSSVSEEDWVGHAVLWQVDVETHQIEMLDLGKLFADDYAIAWSVNNLGQVVGYSLYANRGFLINPLDTNGDEIPDTWYQPGGNGVNALMIDLGSVAGGFPIDINDSGEIVGTTGDVPQACYGFLIRPADLDQNGVPDCWFTDQDGDGLNDLMTPLLPSGRDTRSFSSAINGNGLIAGRSGDNACLWQVDTAGAISASVLGQIKGYDATGLNDLNNHGQAVGAAGTAFPQVFPPKIKQVPCMAENGRLTKLTDLVVDWGTFDSGNTLSRAFGINASGVIVGDMQHHAYIAIPVP